MSKKIKEAMEEFANALAEDLKPVSFPEIKVKKPAFLAGDIITIGPIPIDIEFLREKNIESVLYLDQVKNQTIMIPKVCNHEFVPMFTNIICKHCGVDIDELKEL